VLAGLLFALLVLAGLVFAGLVGAGLFGHATIVPPGLVRQPQASTLTSP
jgi:hypothetical protein